MTVGSRIVATPATISHIAANAANAATADAAVIAAPAPAPAAVALYPRFGPNAPFAVRCAAFAVAAVCAALGLVTLAAAWHTASWWIFGCALVPVLATVGLLRGVRWGRSAASLLGVTGAFLTAAVLMGDMDEPDGRTVLTALLGYNTPLWLDVAFIVAAATAVLAPLVVMGWSKPYFRRSMW